MKTYAVKQQDMTDCGPACLSSICAFYGGKIGTFRLRQWAETGRNGTTVLGMLQAAKKAGLRAHAVKAGEDDLKKITLPAIAHCVLPNRWHHYVVLYQILPRSIKIMDPADGFLKKIPKEQFLSQWSGVLILFTGKTGGCPEPQGFSATQRLIHLFLEYRLPFSFVLSCALICSLLGLGTSLLVKYLVDQVIAGKNIPMLFTLSLSFLFITGLKVSVEYLKNKAALVTGQKIDQSLILRYYAYLFRLPQSFFDSMQTGEMLSRINDAVKIRDLVTVIWIRQCVNFCIILTSMLFMLCYSWKLTLPAALCLPLYGWFYLLYQQKNKILLRKNMENAAEMESLWIENLKAQKTIRYFGVQETICRISAGTFHKLMQDAFLTVINTLKTQRRLEWISGIAVVTILCYGSHLVIQNQLSTGTLVSFYSLILYLLQPLSEIIHSSQQVQDALIATDRIFQILDIPPELDTEGTKVKNFVHGPIVFDQIGFSYGAKTEVLKNCSFSVEPGKITALTGASGAGKSTIFSLLYGLYNPQKGRIYVGGVDTREIRKTDLRKKIGIVPQQIDFFEGSLEENIVLGNQEMSASDVLKLLGIYGIREWIFQLPQGLQTEIGRKGVLLSPGEKQKLAMARALCHHPDILLLDEATSALDAVSEKEMQRCIRMLSEEGKTVLLIAHRFSTLCCADHIVVLKDGCISEAGSHRELYGKGGDYAGLCHRQTDLVNHLVF